MDCKEMELLFPGYAAGTLNKERNVNIKKHLSICKKCQDNSKIFKKIISLLEVVEDSVRHLTMVYPIDDKRQLVFGRSIFGFPKEIKNYAKQLSNKMQVIIHLVPLHPIKYWLFMTRREENYLSRE